MKALFILLVFSIQLVVTGCQACVCKHSKIKVCGEDGITYDSECEAKCRNVVIRHFGPCRGEDVSGDLSPQKPSFNNQLKQIDLLPPYNSYRPPHRPPYRPPHRPTYIPPFRPPYRPPFTPPIRPPHRPPYRPTYIPPFRPPYRPPFTPPIRPPHRPPYRPPYRPPFERPRPPFGPVFSSLVGTDKVNARFRR